MRRPDGPGTTSRPWAAVVDAGGGAVVHGLEEDDLSWACERQPIELDGLRATFLQIDQYIDPPVDLTIEVLPIDPGPTGFCVAVVGPAVHGRLHLVDHRAPTRDGTTTRYMRSEEIGRWVVESQGLHVSSPKGHRTNGEALQLPLD